MRPLQAGSVRDDAVLERQQRVLRQRLPSARGNELLHAGNEAVQRAGQVSQEREHRRTLQVVFHQREAHHVQAEVGRHGIRDDRLVQPVHVDGPAGLRHLVQTLRAAPTGYRLLRLQQAPVLQPPKRRVQRTGAGLVDASGRRVEHLFQPVPRPRLAGDEPEQHLLEIGERTPGRVGWCHFLFQWVVSTYILWVGGNHVPATPMPGRRRPWTRLRRLTREPECTLASGSSTS
jgi:hypothetical protein